MIVVAFVGGFVCMMFGASSAMAGWQQDQGSALGWGIGLFLFGAFLLTLVAVTG